MPADDERPEHVLRELRRTRRHHRVGQIEWFEALYRVYLAAIVGGGSILFLSGLVPDTELTSSELADVTRLGPAALGLVAVVALAMGLRSGANGGPLAVEEADVRFVLLAPLDHRRALHHPAVQRIRAVAFAGALAGAIAGELAARRMPGSIGEWAAWGVVYGVSCALAYVGGALVAHGLRLPRPAAFVIGAVLLVWQGAALATGGDVWGPADPLGHVALWPLDADPVALVEPLVLVALTAVGLALLGRMSLEALARRSGLVAQLRFAVTLQDVRTVMLLRRQLGQEHTRRRPWLHLRRGGRGGVVWRRDWSGLLRFPVRRLGRMALLAVAAGACTAVAYQGVTPAVVGAGLALFVLGLEALEPLSQEIDQVDRRLSYPAVTGPFLLRHLPATAAMLVPFAVIAAGTAVAVEQGSTSAAVAAVMALPITWAGACGAVVNVVKGAPDQTTEAAEGMFMPPEVSGITTVVRGVWPLVVSVVGVLPILLVREAVDEGEHAIATAARSVIACVLLIAATVTWVRYRDDVRRWWRATVDEAQQARTSTGGPR